MKELVSKKEQKNFEVFLKKQLKQAKGFGKMMGSEGEYYRKTTPILETALDTFVSFGYEKALKWYLRKAKKFDCIVRGWPWCLPEYFTLEQDSKNKIAVDVEKKAQKALRLKTLNTIIKQYESGDISFLEFKREIKNIK